jgi:alkylmercury lyase
VAAVLEQATSTEYDKDGNIIGYGLTLRETSYVLKLTTAVCMPGARWTP